MLDPSVRVGFVQIAGVYVDILRLLNANRTGLVDSRELEKAQITQTVNAVLPGSNVTLKGFTGRRRGVPNSTARCTSRAWTTLERGSVLPMP